MQFTGFVKENYGSELITSENWHVVEVLATFLEKFYDETISLSRVYNHTSLLMVHHSLDIATHRKP